MERNQDQLENRVSGNQIREFRKVLSFMATIIWRNCKEKISIASVKRTKYRLQHNKCQYIATQNHNCRIFESHPLKFQRNKSQPLPDQDIYVLNIREETLLNK